VDLSKIKSWKPKKNESIVWHIGILGGANVIDIKYGSEDVPLLPELARLKTVSEKKEYGTTLGIQTGVLLKNRWLINSGIEYHQLWSKLDFEEQKNIQVLKENQLLKVWIDQFTGDTLQKYYNDTLVNAVAYRDLLHHNKYRKFSIPIEIGIQQDYEKFIFGLTAGAVFNFTTLQSGKTINKDQEVIDFEKDDSTAPFKNFDIGFRISPSVGYQLSDRWTISLQPRWDWQRKRAEKSDLIIFDVNQLSINVNQFNLNVGLKYSFY